MLGTRAKDRRQIPIVLMSTSTVEPLTCHRTPEGLIWIERSHDPGRNTGIFHRAFEVTSLSREGLVARRLRPSRRRLGAGDLCSLHGSSPRDSFLDGVSDHASPRRSLRPDSRSARNQRASPAAHADAAFRARCSRPSRSPSSSCSTRSTRSTTRTRFPRSTQGPTGRWTDPLVQRLDRRLLRRASSG